MKPTAPSEGATEAPEVSSGISASPSGRISKRAVFALLAVAGLVGGAIATRLEGRAQASRNASGTYSLPAGNPVSSGTTITSSWANGTLTDIGTELTNSLDRSGRGGMTGALQLANGTTSAPSLSFVSETGSGLYRNASNDVRMSVNQADVQTWGATGSSFPLAVTVTGKIGLNGRTATTYPIEVADSSVSGGTVAQFGTTFPLTLFASASNPNIGFNVANSGAGNKYIASNYAGAINFDSSGNVNFNIAPSGTAGNTPSFTNYASISSAGLKLSTNPSSSTSQTNTLAAKNIVKAWGHLTITGSGGTSASCVIDDGFNLSSCSSPASGLVDVTMASAMANSNYAISAMGDTSSCSVTNTLVEQGNQRTTTVFGINNASAGSFWTNAQVCKIQIMAIGAQ